MSKNVGRVVIAAVVALMLFYVAVTAVLRFGQRSEPAEPQAVQPSTEASEQPNLPAAGPATAEQSESSGSSESPSPSASQGAESESSGSSESPSASQDAEDEFEATAAEIHAELDPDREDAEQTAEAWLTAYGTRDEGDERLWEDTASDWTSDDLMDELSEAGDGEVASRAPTRVQEITIEDQIPDWGPDTPIRWSHQVRVTLVDENGDKFDNSYRIQAQRGDEGWTLTNASFVGITVDDPQGESDDGGE